MNPAAPSVLGEDLSDVTMADEIACVRRELAMRERAYPKWVSGGRMKQAEADRELRRMRAVLKRLLLAELAGRLI